MTHFNLLDLVMENIFVHLAFWLLVIATISNALYSALNRMHLNIYHLFEVIQAVAYVFFGVMVVKSGGYTMWVVITLFIRFALYNVAYNLVMKQHITYLSNRGVDGWVKWILLTTMKQGSDAVGFLYIVFGGCAVFAYINKLYSII